MDNPEYAELPREVLPLLPQQGAWSDSDYLWLTNRTNRLVELADGYIEVLVMPTERHQAIVACVFVALLAFARVAGGKVVFAPFRLRLKSGKFREPDLILLRSELDPRRHDAYWEGADLVVEVVSPDDPGRDLITKRAEYAAAGIPEYWIVDASTETFVVLRLDGDAYTEHGVFRRGQEVNSSVLPGFTFSASEAFDAR
jgi:Uma2 family endonuclease